MGNATRRFKLTAVKRLALTARNLASRACDDPSLRSQAIDFGRFALAGGSNPYQRQSEIIEEFSLAVTSLAAVQAFWRVRGIPELEAVTRFASRDPVCEAVHNACAAIARHASYQQAFCAPLHHFADSLASEVSLAGDATAESPTDPLVGFFEHLFAAFDGSRRRRLGVYFTPAAAVEYLVGRSDEILREEFGFAEGLADTATRQTSSTLSGSLLTRNADAGKEPFIRILDPAMGSGAFLLAVVRHVRATVQRATAHQSRQSHSTSRPWSDYVSASLLPRLHGCEIVPAAYVLANFLLAMELISSGFAPRSTDRLHLRLGDCLARPEVAHGTSPQALENGMPTDSTRPDLPFTVILGNPPYRGSSTNEHRWITRLLKGLGPDGERCASYFHVDGQPLGERKTWLHDDYVKFFRYAHWQIEQSGGGLLAYVSNHGFLDNPTFRGMRAAMLATFGRMELVDLQGNVKRDALADDESLFATSQGMAMTVAWRSGGNTGPRVLHGELTGSRREKLSRLNAVGKTSLASRRLVPRPPNYLLCPTEGVIRHEYEAAPRLLHVMPTHTTAAVTARDWFVVDIDRGRLVSRLREFADLSIPDDVIRARYFQRTRSSRYPPGDTRSWKLSAARRRLAAQTNWERCIRRCWYRPFDRRWIFWSPSMVDWPRSDVMRHLKCENVALVCRRQSVRGKPCNFFWIADDIVVDGYIRSDNRGSESVFPLLLFPGDEDLSGGSTFPQAEGDSLPALNFSTAFVEDCARRIGAAFVETKGDACGKAFTGRQLLHYIYALFHAPTYRTRYAERLAVDFPHILLPRGYDLFHRVASLGEALAEAHLLASPQDCADAAAAATYEGERPAEVAVGFPKFDGQRVWISRTSNFGPISEQAWEFRVGAHQVLRKWLKDRRGRRLDEDQQRTYVAIVAAISQTLEIQPQLEAAVEQAGGWATAFGWSGESVAPGD